MWTPGQKWRCGTQLLAKVPRAAWIQPITTGCSAVSQIVKREIDRDHPATGDYLDGEELLLLNVLHPEHGVGGAEL